jgi:hypothetical protein
MAHVAPHPHRRGPAPLPRPGWALEEEFREEIDEDDPDDPADEEDEMEEDRDDLVLYAARDFNDLARRRAAGVAARTETL